MKSNVIVINDDTSIFAAGPLKLTPGLRPRRVVLRSLPGKFVTHVEYMNIHMEENGVNALVICNHDEFDNGCYFDYGLNGLTSEQALEEARKDYNERLQR